VLFYPITYVGLMLLLRRNVKRFSLASWLDGGVAGLGAAALCATFAFQDVLHHAGGSAAGVAVNCEPTEWTLHMNQGAVLGGVLAAVVLVWAFVSFRRRDIT